MRFETYQSINTFCTKYNDPSLYPPFDKAPTRAQLECLERKHSTFPYNTDYTPTFSNMFSSQIQVPIFKK